MNLIKVDGKGFNWKGNSLYFRTTDTGFGVRTKGEDLFWVKYPDGVLSADYYNLTRAKDHAIAEARKLDESAGDVAGEVRWIEDV